MRDAWRHMKVNRNKEDRGEAVGEKPGKRRRVKDRVRETDTIWRQRELTAEEYGLLTWLHEEIRRWSRRRKKSEARKIATMDNGHG